MRLAAVHFTPTLGEPEQNRAALVALAARAARGADVVVLPELATTGFALTAAEAAAWAEDEDGPTAAAVGAVAREHGAVVVVGLPLRAPAGGLHNAQLVLDADGRIAGRYAKHHLYGSDFAWAQPGPTPGAVVATRQGPVGLLVCHDVVYPATVAALARQRPRLVAFSTAWIGDGELVPTCWSWAARLLDPAPLVVANRGGRERGVRFDDPSAILTARRGGLIGPRGANPEVLRLELGGPPPP